MTEYGFLMAYFRATFPSTRTTCGQCPTTTSVNDVGIIQVKVNDGQTWVQKDKNIKRQSLPILETVCACRQRRYQRI